MVMDETMRVTGQESGILKIIVYADDIVIWELNESTLEKKFHRTIAVCTDLGLSVNLDKCVVMKISWKTVDMEKLECNNHEIMKWSFRRGSRIVTNGSVNEDITERTKMQENFDS
jgi:hypothetical protein